MTQAGKAGLEDNEYADRNGRHGMITGDHFYLYPGGLAPVHGPDCIFPRWVDHPCNAHQGQTGFQVCKLQFTVIIPDGFKGNGKYTLAPTRHGLYLLLPVTGVDWNIVADSLPMKQKLLVINRSR